MTHSSDRASGRSGPSGSVAAERRAGGAHALDGALLLGRAATDVLERPLLSLAWVFGLAAAVVVGPVWGAAFAMMGWIAARERMAREGVAGLGSVLAPELAARQFDRGLFTGIWRTQKLGWSLALVQAPAALLCAAPAAIAYALLAPAAALLPGDAGTAVGLVVPGALGLVAFVMIAAQSILAHRLLAAVGPDHSLGLVSRAVGAAWRTTLREGAALAVLAAGFVATTVVAGLFVYGNSMLADALSLGAGRLVVVMWTGALAGALALAVVLEALASWAENVDTEPFTTVQGFSFSQAISAWFAHVTGGGAARLAALGVFCASTLGLVASSLAVAAGTMSSSLPALGWFTATLAALVVLHIVRRCS